MRADCHFVRSCRKLDAHSPAGVTGKAGKLIWKQFIGRQCRKSLSRYTQHDT